MMPGDNNNESSKNTDYSTKPTRRTFLGSLATGISLGGTNVASAKNTRVDVPVGRKYGERIFRSVPKEWADHAEQVRFVRQRVEEQFQNTTGVTGFSITVNDNNSIGNLKKLDVKILVDGDEFGRNADGKFPDSVNNIDILVKETPKFEARTCEHKKSYNPAPGGVQIDVSDVGHLTLCCQAYHKDMEEYVGMSALHGFVSENLDTYEVSEAAFQDKIGEYSGGQHLGEPIYTGFTGDIVAYANGSLDYSGGIMTDEGEMNLSGIYTNYEYLASSEYPVWKTGVTTGEDKGLLRDTSYYYYYPMKSGSETVWVENTGVKINIAGADGDSGGPAYVKTGNGEVMLVGLFQATSNDKLDEIPCTDGLHWYRDSYAFTSYDLYDRGFRFWM